MNDPTPAGVSGIVFDLDGTLVDSLPDITAALQVAFGDAGTTLTPDQVAPAIGHGARDLVRDVAAATAPELIPDEAALDALLARYQAAYAASPAGHTTAFADAVTALTELHRRGVLLGVCTNKSTALARTVLDAVGLAPAMSVVRGFDSVSYPKPDPRHLLDAIADLGLGVDQIVYVGDNPVDVTTAHGAGVRYRHVAWGEPVDGAEVTRIERFADLLGVVGGGHDD
jgi:phosphoglycolate phosphatase